MNKENKQKKINSVKRPLNSLYIHIPFCIDKCHYCSFISFINKDKYVDLYTKSLLGEIEKGLEHVNNLKTLYIGGGTPSVIEISYYEALFALIEKKTNIKNIKEITMEINPGTVDATYLKSLKKLGINRLSIGIQSFDDNMLKMINRKHTANEALNIIKSAQSIGFDNISIDLIYGLPSQSLEDWKKTLKKAMHLNIQHISTYGLKIEKGTYFGNNKPENIPDEDLCADMYIETIEILLQNGFEHYETSNFCKNGYESKHNLCYWNNEEYVGAGVSAHGYLNGIRYANTSNIEVYIKNPFKKENSHTVSFEEAVEEAIFLGLRQLKGLNIENFKKEYGIDLLQEYKKAIDKHSKDGFMEIKDSCLKFTAKGMLLSNSILGDFLIN